jgi:hypothetical protein
MHRSKGRCYSITSAASASSFGRMAKSSPKAPEVAAKSWFASIAFA